MAGPLPSFRETTGIGLIAAAMLVVGCGSSADELARDLPPPVCDLYALATTLVGGADLCPPAEVFVSASRGEADPGPQRAEWDDGQACTQFTIEDDGCGAVCAPRRCWLEGGRVACDQTCNPNSPNSPNSPNRTTCYVIPESACAKP